MAKAKKRTTAQRRAAAKAAWELRRLKGAAAPPPNTAPIAVEVPVQYLEPPVTMTATKEGAEFFLTISNNGAVLRQRVPAMALRKLGLDALAIVG